MEATIIVLAALVVVFFVIGEPFAQHSANSASQATEQSHQP